MQYFRCTGKKCFRFKGSKDWPWIIGPQYSTEKIALIKAKFLTGSQDEKEMAIYCFLSKTDISVN